MEVFYGIVVLLAFILGLGIGITIPFFMKKYAESLKKEENSEKNTENKIEEKEDAFKYLPRDILNEWMTGEVTKKDEQ